MIHRLALASQYLIALSLVALATAPLALAADNALNFDGSNDFVDIGNPTELRLTGAMTLTAWVWIDSFTSSGRIVSKSGGPGNRGWSLNLESSGSAVAFQIAPNASTLMGVGHGGIATGTWVHLVGVYEPGERLELYVNGILEDFEDEDVPSSQNNTGLNVNIGRRPDVQCHFDGKIDEVRIYSRALSASEITTMFNGGAGQYGSPTETGLVSGWHLDETSGTTAQDYHANDNDGTLQNFATSPSPWVTGKVQATQTVATPTITPNGGTISASTNITLATTTSGASIRYTTNGSTPTTSSILYANPFPLSASATVKVKAFKSGITDSDEASATFTVDSTPPQVTITSPQDGSVIIP